MKTSKKIWNATNQFLVQCYFGSMENGAVVAAIDRAYIDMQTHTVRGEKEDLFTRRKVVTEILYKRIQELVNDEKDFDKWHRNVSKEIKTKYPDFTFGQIQKWINMTIKYLFVLRQLDITGISD